MSRPKNEWNVELARETGRNMKIEEEPDDFCEENYVEILNADETEIIVENLKQFSLGDVGSSVWMKQHQALEKLNVQSHLNVRRKCDDYVLESFLTFNKITLLVRDLILIDTWKETVYPIIVKSLAGKNSMRIYFILYHEATLVNLLELFFFHRHVCQQSSGEHTVELVDYVARRLIMLNANAPNIRKQFSTPTAGSAQDYVTHLQSQSPMEELTQQYKDIEVRVCFAAVSIGAFLCTNADVLPLPVVARIVDTHDFLQLLIPLVEEAPWARRVDNRFQKLKDFQWKDVPAIDLLKVIKLDAQLWFGVFYLLGLPVFNERYHINSFRKNQLLRIRKYINQVMCDQLPFLADIQRYLDELTLSNVGDHNSSLDGKGVFLLQQVAVVREGILKQAGDLQDVCTHQLERVFTMTDRTDKDLQTMADLYVDCCV